MGNKLKILSEGELDFLSLGALNHRVDSGVIPFGKVPPVGQLSEALFPSLQPDMLDLLPQTDL